MKAIAEKILRDLAELKFRNDAYLKAEHGSDEQYFAELEYTRLEQTIAGVVSYLATELSEAGYEKQIVDAFNLARGFND